MQLVRDLEHFDASRIKQLEQLEEELASARWPVRGANRRVGQVIERWREFEQFDRYVANLLANRAFSSLPPISIIHAEKKVVFRKLTVGVWQGTFLPNDDGSIVYAVSFSREPHDFASLLEVAQAQREPKAPES